MTKQAVSETAGAWPLRRRSLLAILPCLLAAPALAAWPERPLRLIVAYPPGGGTDIMARAFAQRLQAELGQPVVVENRGGGSGSVGMQAGASAPPDGYTLTFISTNEMSLQPLLDRRLPYDPERDFEPISGLGTAPVVLAVNARVPARDIAELIALARSQPGRLSYASAGTGGVMHLTGEMFRHRAGIDILHVPYRGAAPAVTDTASGTVQMVFMGLPPLLPLAAEGRVRILAIASPQRSAALPDVPTLAEAGLEGFDMVNAVGVVAPRGTPAEIVARLSAASIAAVRDPATREVFLRNGADVVGSPPAEFAAYARAERARFAEVLRVTGVTLAE